IQAAPAGDRAVGVRLDLRAVRHVGRHRVRLVADLARDVLDRVAVHVDARDPRALLREPDRARAADPGPRAGDDRDLARESIAHRRPPCGTTPPTTRRCNTTLTSPVASALTARVGAPVAWRARS